MSHSRSTKALNYSKTFSTLALNGGNDCKGVLWDLPVDLKVKGGMLVKKSICAQGNVAVNKNANVDNDFNANCIIAGNLGPSVNSFNVDGKFCLNGVITGDVLASNLNVTQDFSATKFQTFGLLGNCIKDTDEDTQVCANDDNTVTMDVQSNRYFTLQPNGGVQYSEGTTTGNLAHSQGYMTLASGEYSHAEGVRTTSSGFASHAEGINTTASGEFSHAEGDSTLASGYASHAEGLQTIVSGRASHVEGQGSVVTGNVSHVEGYMNTVTSDYSHVEGQFNLSSSYLGMDHIEGRNNVSTDSGDMESGLNHIEGECNLATGYCCHIEGTGNEVTSRYCHVGGVEAKGDQYGMWARSAGKIDTAGDAQTSMLMGCMKLSVANGYNDIFSLNYPEVPAIYPVIPTDQCWMFDLYVAGKDNTTVDYYGEKFEMMIQNSADTLTIMSNSLVTLKSGTMSGSSVTFTSSGNIFEINVSSSSANDANWAFTMFNTQVM
jgi:hypothetical protein